MLQQAIDFKEESLALHALVEPLAETDFSRETQFKSWTIDDVIAHLHLFNHAVTLSLEDEKGFAAFYEDLKPYMGVPNGLRDFGRDWVQDLSGQTLLRAWIDAVGPMAEAFGGADPKRRLKWVGPGMSVLSSISARLMETWAHGQAVYDLLGVDRIEHDRIKNIAFMGVNTFGWTFRNRGLPVPETPPHVRLVAPSGAVWTWHEERSESRIEGSAAEFCQVVTQVRNVADTGLVATGRTAQDWMAFAQCFAGAPEDPPPPGTRFKQRAD